MKARAAPRSVPAHIDKVWTDMRPESAQGRMEQLGADEGEVQAHHA